MMQAAGKVYDFCAMKKLTQKFLDQMARMQGLPVKKYSGPKKDRERLVAREVRKILKSGGVNRLGLDMGKTRKPV
jgi:hypothetical protein